MLKQKIFNIEKIEEMWRDFLIDHPDPSIKLTYTLGILHGLSEASKYDGKYKSIMHIHEGKSIEVIDVNALIAVHSKMMVPTAVQVINTQLLKENEELRNKLNSMTVKVKPSKLTEEEVADVIKNDTDMQDKPKKKTRKKKNEV